MNKNLFSAIALAALLSSCTSVTPVPDYYRADVVYADAIPAPVITHIPPPPLQVEVMNTPPVPGYFWVSGVWLWEGGRHVWHPGYWTAPRPGYTWVPHRWYQEGVAWRMDGGHWQRH